MKILYVSAISNQISGGTSVMNRNLELIKAVPRAEVEEVKVSMQSKVSALIAALTGGNFILSRIDEKMIVKKVLMEHFDFVFQEGTSSGHLAQSLAKKGTRLIVFAHNVESMLYEERMNSYKFNPLEAIKYISIKRNETKSTRYCSKLVALTQRDANNFFIRYERKVDAIIPISFNSRLKVETSETKKESYCLFVGSNFFPNVEGMNWFIDNVVPYIKMKTKIAGTCCNGLKPLSKKDINKVEYLGLVDDLDPLYKEASIVIAPIFKGSGMKTKTIEAMSYGKTIIGTDECFQGIDCDYKRIGALCNTASEFIDAINNFDGGLVNEYTLNLFEQNYSNEAVQEKFNKLFV